MDQPNVRPVPDEPRAMREMTDLEKSRTMADHAWRTAAAMEANTQAGRLDGAEALASRVRAYAAVAQVFGSLATDERLARMEDHEGEVEALRSLLEEAQEALARSFTPTQDEAQAITVYRAARSMVPEGSMPILQVFAIPGHLATQENVTRLVEAARETTAKALAAEADRIVAEAPLGHQGGQA